jgi:hypothetical protein
MTRHPSAKTTSSQPGVRVSEVPATLALSRWSIVAVPALAFALYLVTAARDVVVGDSGEFLSASATLGVAHPPGYPLLVMLGHVFSLLPIGPLPFRINLVAVASSVLTVAVVVATARRIGADALAASIAGLTLAVHPLFWEWSLAIEAFPLNNLFAAGVLYFLVRWEREPERGLLLAGAALCGGLGSSNHLTIVFLVPAVAVVMWRRREHIRMSTLVACAAAVVVGLLPYLYILWAASRHPFINWGNIDSFEGLVRHFLRSDYGTGNLVAAGGATGTPTERLLGYLKSFTGVEAMLLAGGVIRARRSVRWYLLCVLATAGLSGPAFVAYANIDAANPVLLWVLSRFFLLSHVTLAPLLALGFTELVARANGIAILNRFRPRTLFATLAALTIVATAAWQFPAIDQRTNHVARTFAEDVLQTVEPHGIVMPLGDEAAFPIAYLQSVEGRRPDVTLIMLGVFRSLPWYIPQLRARDSTLVIPFDRYDPGDARTALRGLLDANPHRSFALVGAAPDNTYSEAYWLRRRGLIEQFEPMATDVSLDAAVAETERLLASYRVPDWRRIHGSTFEIALLTKYATVPKALGDQFALLHLGARAETWYHRALKIYPDFADAQLALQALQATR